MSSDWSNALKLLQARKPARIAIIGIGQELRGDDSVGVMIVRKLKSVLDHQQSVLIIEGGHAPENQTGILRRFAPGVVLFVDAAQMGAAAGEVRLLTSDQLDGLSASTHTLPLSIIADYLSTELDCEVLFMGIQPAQMGFGADLSLAVQEAVKDVVEGIATVLLYS